MQDIPDRKPSRLKRAYNNYRSTSKAWLAMFAAFIALTAYASDFYLGGMICDTIAPLTAHQLIQKSAILPADPSEIAYGMVDHTYIDKLKALTEQLPDGSPLRLAGPGGDTALVKQATPFILGQSHPVEVRDGQVCMSACVGIFAAYQHRILADNAYLGFHPTSLETRWDIKNCAFCAFVDATAVQHGVPIWPWHRHMMEEWAEAISPRFCPS